MLPVLFSFGPVAISSFGFFLSVGFLYGTFLVWRLSRGWDLNEERILDLLLLTFLSGLIGARIYFVLLHSDFFASDLSRIFSITKYPGLSFWGAILGGWLAITSLATKFKLDVYRSLDLAAIGFLAGLIWADLGCLLGGCSVGVQSNLFWAVDQVGVIGKRFPVQLLEAIILMVILKHIWSKAVHFHTPGKIASLALIYLGVSKFLTDFLRSDRGEGQIFCLILIILGMMIFYKVDKKNFQVDLNHLLAYNQRVIIDSRFRNYLLQKFFHYCYNQSNSFFKNKKIELAWRFKNLGKFLKKINVRPTPKDTR